jgi:hypothetical protein
VTTKRNVVALVSGTPVPLLRGTGQFSIDYGQGRRATLTLTRRNARCALREPVDIYVDSVHKFSGTVEFVDETGSDQAAYTYRQTATCVDKFSFFERTPVARIWAAGNQLDDVVEDLVDMAQANSFALSINTLIPAVGLGDVDLIYDYVGGDTVIADLETRTGYFCRVQPNGGVEFFQPSAGIPAPFAITDTDSHSSQVTKRGSRTRVNRVYVRGGTEKSFPGLQRWYGNGVLKAFTTDYAAALPAPANVTVNANSTYPVGTYGVDDWEWTWDNPTFTLHQSNSFAPIASSLTVDLPYTVQWPFTVMAEDSVDISSFGVYWAMKTYENAPDKDYALYYAGVWLRKLMQDTEEVEITTREDGLQHGQTIPISLTKQDIIGDYLITNLRCQSVGHDMIEYVATAIGATEQVEDNLQVFRDWQGGASASGASAGAGVTLITVSGAVELALGGSRQIWIPAILANTYYPVAEYIERRINSASYGGVSLRVRASIWARTAGHQVRVQCWNVTDGSKVGESAWVTSTTPVEVTFGVTPTSGTKSYRLEIECDTTGGGMYVAPGAQLEAA